MRPRDAVQPRPVGRPLTARQVPQQVGTVADSPSKEPSETLQWYRPWLRYPERLRLWFTLCIAGVSMSLTFGSFTGGSCGGCAHCPAGDDRKLWCDKSYQAACKAQGSLLQFFGLAAALWWLAIALNTYITVVRERSVEVAQRLERYYHIVAWGVASAVRRAARPGLVGTGGVPGFAACG